MLHQIIHALKRIFSELYRFHFIFMFPHQFNELLIHSYAFELSINKISCTLISSIIQFKKTVTVLIFFLLYVKK